MEEENYAIFEVCIVDDYADFNYLQNQRVIIPYKDSEVITVKSLRNIWRYTCEVVRGAKKN